MALTAEQQTQATQLSNAVPWVYPSVSNAGFWDNYFSGSGPSLTPAEQASGISLGPMTASPAPQPQVLPGFNPDFVGPPSPQPAMPPAPAPAVPYQSELIRSLRQASPGFTSNNPGVTMLANPANSNTVIDFQRRVMPGLLPPPAPAPAPVAPPAPAPAPVSGGGGEGGGGGGVGPITIGPITPLPRIDVVPDDDFVGPMPDDFVGPMPDDFVGPMPDDFVGPMPDDFMGPMPDDFVGPYGPMPNNQLNPNVTVNDVDVTDTPAPATDPADDFQIDRELGIVQQTDVVNPSPLPPSGDDDFVGPMPDDFVGPMPDDFVGPMPDDFVGPMPDDFVGPMPDDLVDTPATVPDYTNDLWGPDEVVPDVPDYTNDLWGPDESVDAVPDYTNDLWGPEDPALTDQDYFEMALFDLMAQELLTGGGGSGRPGNNMNILAYE